jgi:acyltransferase
MSQDAPSPSATPGGRIKWVDSVRGFAIILVVMGHTVNPAGMLAKIIYSFHLPLFFMISGYLVNAKESVAAKTLKLARSIMVPYTVSTILFFLLWLTFECPSPLRDTPWPPIREIFKGVIVSGMYATGQVNIYPPFKNINPIGPLWFLPCLFLTILISLILLKINNKWIMAVVSVVLVFLGLIIAHTIFLPWSLDLALIAQLFVLIGVAMRSSLLLHNIKIYLFALLPTIGLWIFCCHRVVISMNNRDFGNPLLTIPLSALISMQIIHAFSIMERVTALSYVYKVLSFFGANAIIVLLFQLYVINHIPDKSFIHYNWEFETCFVLLVCSLLAVLVNNSVIMQLLFKTPSHNTSPALPATSTATTFHR